MRPGPAAQFLQRELRSAALGSNVTYGAYVPAQAQSTRLPLLCLLHGADASHDDFRQHAHDQLVQLAAAHQLIIMLPEGAKDGWYVDSPSLPNHRYATHLLQEVLPDAARWLPCDDRRAIAGISAGGNAAIVSALNNPAQFVSVSSLSGALDLELARSRAALVRALGSYDADPALWQSWSARHVLRQHAQAALELPWLLSVGDTDLWADTNRAFAGELRALCAEVEWRELPGGHTWSHWLAVLAEHIAFHARYLNARQ